MDPETRFADIANVGVKDGRIAATNKEKITGIVQKNAPLSPSRNLSAINIPDMIKYDLL
jgi:hypothetical protein